MVRICGVSCVNVSKRFVESDTYSLLWCVNLPLNWRTRCDAWTNDTSTQIRHFFSYTRCANHDAWRITNTNHASCGPSFIIQRKYTKTFEKCSASQLCLVQQSFDGMDYPQGQGVCERQVEKGKADNKNVWKHRMGRGGIEKGLSRWRYRKQLFNIFYGMIWKKESCIP